MLIRVALREAKRVTGLHACALRCGQDCPLTCLMSYLCSEVQCCDNFTAQASAKLFYLRSLATQTVKTFSISLTHRRVLELEQCERVLFAPLLEDRQRDVAHADA